MTVTPDDLATYLGATDIDEDRAQMLITDVLVQALDVVTVGTVLATGPTWDNLPPGSDGIVRAAVARLYLNPTGATSETAGPFATSRPAPSGSALSRRERQTLRRLAGRGASFSIDATPTTAMSDFIDPLAEPTSEDAEQEALDEALT